jgi:hypothetical protein
MNTKTKVVSFNQEQLLTLVRALAGANSGREDDEHPLKKGPWGPVIRIALERIGIFGARHSFEPILGPHPEPWKLVLASIIARHPEIIDGLGGGQLRELNPQPLPPRSAFLAALVQTVVERAELIQEFAEATRNESEQRGIIIVSGYVSRFIGDCGSEPFRWPFHWPRPNWFEEKFNATDLVIMAAQFEQAARETFSSSLEQNLKDASVKLAEMGLAKMH